MAKVLIKFHLRKFMMLYKEEAFNEKEIQPKRRVFDNGSESSKFIELETTLQTSIYFADIHNS